MNPCRVGGPGVCSGHPSSEVPTRTSDTSGRYTAAVVQKEYLMSIANYNDIPGAEPYTLMVRYP